MNNDYIIRDARKEEAIELAVLVNHAGRGPNNKGLDFVGWSLAAKEGEGPYEYGGRIIASEEGKYSYLNMRVIEANGKVAALSLCFEVFERTEEEMKLIPEEFRIFKELTNTIAGKFYLDSLAALPEFRGNGFGKLILEDSILRAKNAGYDEVYLIVFEQNKKALGLYEKAGFKPHLSLPGTGHKDMPYGGNVVLYKKDI
jgi:ribosomal protein S18 acetylase RimI-like enzyme